MSPSRLGAISPIDAELMSRSSGFGVLRVSACVAAMCRRAADSQDGEAFMIPRMVHGGGNRGSSRPSDEDGLRCPAPELQVCCARLRKADHALPPKRRGRPAAAARSAHRPKGGRAVTCKPRRPDKGQLETGHRATALRVGSRSPGLDLQRAFISSSRRRPGRSTAADQGSAARGRLRRPRPPCTAAQKQKMEPRPAPGARLHRIIFAFYRNPGPPSTAIFVQFTAQRYSHSRQRIVLSTDPHPPPCHRQV